MADILKPAFRATSGLDAAGEKVINVAKADYNVLDDGVNVEFFIDENTIQAYDETRGYKKGFAVIHDQRIWVAQRDIAAPAGTFVPGYWTATRTDPKWITVASPTRQLASGEYIAVDSAASFTTFTLPPNPTDGDTVVIKDIGGRVGYNEIKVQSSSAPGGGNQKIVRFGNQFSETLITKPFSYNMLIFANRLWHFWEAGNEERGIRVEPNTAQFQSQAGDNVLRRYTSGAVIKFTLPKYANQGDMVKTVDIDGLGSKFHLIVETFDASSSLGKPGQHSMEFRTSGDGFFVYNSVEKMWYVWDGDRQTRLRVIRDDVELLANESIIVFGENNSTPQTINITLPTGVAIGDTVKIALNYLRKGQTVNIKAVTGDKIASSVQLLQFPKRSEYPPDTEWVLVDSLTFNGNISYTPVIELSYIEDHVEDKNYWVVAQNVPTVERVDSKDDLTRARLGVIALASQTQANVDHENNPEKELAITPQTLANRVATETRRGIARIATTAQVNQDTTFAFQDDLIISPKKLNERTATETRRGVAEIATQQETDSGVDDTTIITPKKLQTRQGTESLSGIVKYTSTVDTTPATARDTVGTNVYNKNVGNLVISPKALDQYKATQAQQGTVYLSTQSEVNTGQSASGFANSAVSPETLHARVALDTRTGLIEIATQVETDTGTDYTRAVTPKTLNDRKATEGLTGIARIATQAEFDAGTLDNVISTPLKIKTRLNDTARTSVSAASGLIESGTLWNHYTLDIREANETQRGTARLATQTEVNVGTDDKTIITPLKLHSKKSTESSEGIIRVATNTETTAGTSKVLAVSPSGLKYVVQTETTWEATALRRGFVKLTEGALTYSGNKVTGSGVKFNSGTGLYENDDTVLNAANYPKTGYAVSSYEMNKTLQNFLPINATAVNSEKLDGLDSLQFIRRDVDQTVNGSLTLTKQLNLAAPLVSSSTATFTDVTATNSTFGTVNVVNGTNKWKITSPSTGTTLTIGDTTNVLTLNTATGNVAALNNLSAGNDVQAKNNFVLNGRTIATTTGEASGATLTLGDNSQNLVLKTLDAGNIIANGGGAFKVLTEKNAVEIVDRNFVNQAGDTMSGVLRVNAPVRVFGTKPTLASQVPTAETVGFWSVDINDEATYSKFPGYHRMILRRHITIDTIQTKPPSVTDEVWKASGWLTLDGTFSSPEIHYLNEDGTEGAPVLGSNDEKLRGQWFDFFDRDKNEIKYPGTLTQFGNTLDSCYQDWICYPVGLNGGTIRYTRTWQKNKNEWTDFAMVYTAANPPTANDVGALPADNATMKNITILDWLRIGNVRIIPDPVTKSVKFEWIE
ncbi:long tail fiber proximal subunit [Enterobacteria phage vB_EcoM_IME281]|uniref:Long tail fiber proximal subunit n=1 Tax=Enterobacteria phage vB_EcoM_IME281 TaxID=2163887 RepID=A0A2S1GNT1_9CAUD|nr:tail fiber protein proximal subunit [Enterobacteria phage vB_EcoM_IME281]AWD91039.1 long tail fiber proximal subunit [Enterobacteria phage vB_EcoM_IME281]QAY00001.1 long tail fiber, proximal subunit [Escherichia phage EcWhh-1]